MLNANQLRRRWASPAQERISSQHGDVSHAAHRQTAAVPKDKLIEWIEQNTGGSHGEEKKRLPPIPSVAPDGEQPSALARTDSITEIEETHKQFGKIQIMTMPELMETRFRVRPAVIEGLLPAGTYLLAGAPKIGKSFLVLQMAYQVSMGAPFLGFSSRQGTVLYLALRIPVSDCKSVWHR